MCGSSNTAHLCHRGTDTPIAAPRGSHYPVPMPDPRRLGTRVNLTLPDEVVSVLDRLGKVTGAGRATIVREWLIEGAPMFAEMARAAELASQKNVDALKVMGDVLRSAVADGEQLELQIRRERRAAMRKRQK